MIKKAKKHGRQSGQTLSNSFLTLTVQFSGSGNTNSLQKLQCSTALNIRSDICLALLQLKLKLANIYPLRKSIGINNGIVKEFNQQAKKK